MLMITSKVWAMDISSEIAHYFDSNQSTHSECSDCLFSDCAIKTSLKTLLEDDAGDLEICESCIRVYRDDLMGEPDILDDILYYVDNLCCVEDCGKTAIQLLEDKPNKFKKYCLKHKKTNGKLWEQA